MQDKRLLYQRLFLDWLGQYHSAYLEYSDVLHKLQYLKNKLVEYQIRDSIKPRMAQAAWKTFMALMVFYKLYPLPCFKVKRSFNVAIAASLIKS